MISILEKDTLQILHLYLVPNFTDNAEETRPTVIPNNILINNKLNKILNLLLSICWAISCFGKLGSISAIVRMFSGIKTTSFIGIAHTTNIIVPAKIP